MHHCLAAICLVLASQASDLQPDERLIFFPTYGRHVDAQQCWRIRVHGWAYQTTVSARTIERTLRALNIDLDSSPPGARAMLARRLTPFLADNKRGRHGVIRIGASRFPLMPCGADGHAYGEFDLPDRDVRRLAEAGDLRDGVLRYSLELPPGDSRRIEGAVMLLNGSGLSIVSDIDDTLRITGVRDKGDALRNTFLEEFRPVAGMAEVYRGWAAAGAAFHYLSASPAQLYEPLSEFLEREGFPRGTVDLRPFRLKTARWADIHGSAETFKPARIEQLLRDFPDRRFVLVGDDQMTDPQIYADIARRFPGQVSHVLIRSVDQDELDFGEPPVARRGGPAAETRFVVFREAGELAKLLLPPAAEPGHKAEASH